VEGTLVNVDHESSRVFGPPRGTVIGGLIAAVVFGVVLEFLVMTSFVGQRLWLDPRLGHEIVFSLPFVIWFVVVVGTILYTLRSITSWMQVDGRGFRLQGLGRRTVVVPWQGVDRVVAVRDMTRWAAAVDAHEADADTYDHVSLRGPADEPLASVSGKQFTRGAHEALLRSAREAGVRTEVLEVPGASAIPTQLPGALSFSERHSALLVLAIAFVYIAQNIVTFGIWGL
jgi:hypothetical protein